MAIVTVQGGNAPVQSISFSTADTLVLARTLAATINAIGAAKAPTSIATYLAGGADTVPAGISAVVVNATAPVMLTGSADVQSVIAAGGGLTFDNTASGSFSLVAAAGANALTLGAATSYDVVTGDGNDTVTASGSGTIDGGGGTNAITLTGVANTVAAAGQNDVITSSDTMSDQITEAGSGATVTGGAAVSTVFHDEGTDNVFMGSNASAEFDGSTEIYGGSQGSYTLSANFATVYASQAPNGSDTIGGENTGENSFLYVQGGTSDDIGADETYFTYDSTGGHATISATNFENGDDQIVGAPGAFIDFETNDYGGSAIVAGAGNETLSAANSDGPIQFSAGSGNASLVGGSGGNSFAASTGLNTITGGAGANFYEFVAGSTGGVETITDFKQNTGYGAINDQVQLSGYGANEVADALATAKTTGAGTMITLADNTRVLFANVASLHPQNFSGS